MRINDFRQIQLRFTGLFFRGAAAALLFLLVPGMLWAQSRERAKIDSLRWGYSYESAEAYRRAKQAQHIDSTYYVGYLIEGYHHFERAEEHSGLAKAVAPLRKALDLFEKDFSYALHMRITRDDIFAGFYRELFRQLDYYDMSNRLISAYLTLEQPDSAYSATQRLMEKDLVFDFQSLHWLSWLYFRTRIYTSKKYAFLGNSIEENMRLALAFTDSMEARYRRNVPFIKSQILGAVARGSPFYNAFENSFVRGPLSTIANTRGILYGYNLNPALAASYFKKMEGDDGLAKMVNLGFTYLSAVDLRTAEEYFRKVPDFGARSRGGHWQGFSIVYVSKNEPLAGALTLRDDRDKHGYSIGYGWDNLCIARMFLYAGNLDESRRALAKAETFTEVHYNTSFREDQYRFLLRTLRLLNTQFEIREHQFENKNRWLSFDWWKSFPLLTFQKYTTLYRLANEMAENPERDMVFYRLFHTESIISYDELWFVIRNYSRDFFEKKFREHAADDPRTQLRRYYQYFLGRLLMAEGESEKAYDTLTEILNTRNMDREYEKLLIARIHESCAHIAADEGWRPQHLFHLNMLYQTYPQLVPFSGLQMGFRLQLPENLRNSADGHLQRLLTTLKGFNIDWDPPEDARFPEVELSLTEDGQIQYHVLVNREVFTQGFVDPAAPEAGKSLAYRLFKIIR